MSRTIIMIKIFFLLQIIFFYGCINENKNSKSESLTLENSEEIIKDIPIDEFDTTKKNYDFFYHLLKDDLNSLGLESMESGYDSLKLRIWLGHSLAIKRHIVTVKKNKGKWTAHVFSFERFYEDNKPETYIKKKNKSVFPKSGWKAFEKTLINLKITELPHCNDIPGYNGCGSADGIGYSFELAKKQYYKFYYYCNPLESSDRYWQAQNVLKFSNFLEKEFEFVYTK